MPEIKEDKGSETKKRKAMANEEAPQPQPLYISTMSKIAYLDGDGDEEESEEEGADEKERDRVDRAVFWAIPLVKDASTPGVLNKQILLTSSSEEELAAVRARIDAERGAHCVDEQVNAKEADGAPRKRKKTHAFRDERKVTIGTITPKGVAGALPPKPKSAFMNCFVLQINVDVGAGRMREFHTKVFNTGKVEIPGVQTEAILTAVLDVLQSAFDRAHQDGAATQYRFRRADNAFLTDMVLINSNFRCGFQINRQACFAVLKHKYGVPAIYDPCTYPGVKCRYYYDPDLAIAKQKNQFASPTLLHRDDHAPAQKVSFMIFRTGSVLIVGKCPEHVLRYIYAFVIRILRNEYHSIVLHSSDFLLST